MWFKPEYLKSLGIYDKLITLVLLKGEREYIESSRLLLLSTICLSSIYIVISVFGEYIVQSLTKWLLLGFRVVSVQLEMDMTSVMVLLRLYLTKCLLQVSKACLFC